MNVTGARIVKLLLKGDADRAELRAVGIKRRQVDNVLADLQKRGYAVGKGAGRVGLPDTPKAALLRDAAASADIEVLLRGSNEDVLCRLRSTWRPCLRMQAPEAVWGVLAAFRADGGQLGQFSATQSCNFFDHMGLLIPGSGAGPCRTRKPR